MNEIDNFPNKVEDDEITLEIHMVVNGQAYSLGTKLKGCKDKTYQELAEEIDKNGKILTRSCSGLFKGKSK